MSVERLDHLASRVQVLEAAVNRLAAENLRYRRAGGVILVLAASALLMAPAAPPQASDEVRARRFVLVDSRDQSRGTWTTTPDGASLLALTDGRQQVRLSLSVTGAGTPTIGLSDTAGRPRLVAGIMGDAVSLALMSAQSRMGAALVVESETSRLGLADSSGVERLWVAIRKESPVLQFFDRKRVARSGLSTINDDAGVAVISESPGAAAPGLVLFGKDGKLLWAAPQ